MPTGLAPAMTLGCGGCGGNITSDTISPRHLLNIKRLAYETRPARALTEETPATRTDARPELPRAPLAHVSRGIGASLLAGRIDEFLASRGLPGPGAGPAGPPAVPTPPSVQEDDPVDFVCEDDVRAALAAGRKIRIGERAIVTPAARGLGGTRGGVL